MVFEKRVSRRVPIVARVEAHGGAGPHIILAQNISVGGMLVRTADTLPEGDTIQLRFMLPGIDREIRATAVVQHVTPGEFMGVRFTELGPEDAAAIREFVEKA
ncbi:MAG TPA: PilZ domain-containing protein [Candidatus Xenobia bacterium]|nr:PilZ domain-containing protein [Candidatus Xenobia bacterium]